MTSIQWPALSDMPLQKEMYVSNRVLSVWNVGGRRKEKYLQCIKNFGAQKTKIQIQSCYILAMGYSISWLQFTAYNTEAIMATWVNLGRIKQNELTYVGANLLGLSGVHNRCQFFHSLVPIGVCNENKRKNINCSLNHSYFLLCVFEFIFLLNF